MAVSAATAGAGTGAAVSTELGSAAIGLLAGGSKAKRLFGAVGLLVQKFNLPEHGIKYVARKMKTNDAIKVIEKGLGGVIGKIIDELQFEMDEKLETKVLEPCKLKNEALMQAREERKNHVGMIEQLKRELQADIQLLNRV